MKLTPVTFRVACAFVEKLHRHNKPPRGHKFSIGLAAGPDLVGVVMCGRPIARALDDGFTLEVNRTCTDGTSNANSMLYGAAWRAGRAMGYTRCITYTQADESGVSLRAAGWVRVKVLPPRKSWAESTKSGLVDMRDPVGNGGVARILWEIKQQETQPMSADQLVANYLKLRAEKKRITKEAETLVAKIDTVLEAMETKMLKLMIDQKVKNMGTELGTMYIEKVVRPQCTDWHAYRTWMIQNDALDGVEKRVTKSFIVDYMKDNEDELPPGITVLKEQVARVRTTS